MFMIMRYENDNGEFCEFEPKNFKPLSYSELLEFFENKTNFVDLTMKVDSINFIKGREIKENGKGEVKTKVQFGQRLPIYSLVELGWLPPPFVRPSNLLVDRNVISNFKKLLQNPSKENSQYHQTREMKKV